VSDIVRVSSFCYLKFLFIKPAQQLSETRQQLFKLSWKGKKVNRNLKSNSSVQFSVLSSNKSFKKNSFHLPDTSSTTNL